MQHKFTNNHDHSNIQCEEKTIRSTSKKIDRVDESRYYDSQIVKGGGRLRKTIGKTIQKDLIINDISKDMVYYRIHSIQWHQLIHVANHT